MTMVAVGGSIGTGLLLGSAPAIAIAGPGVIVSFLLAAFMTWLVTMALGELASTHPAAGSFGVYGDLYLNEWAGFISRAGYWAAIAMSVGAELVASATYMTYWFPRVPALAWIVLFSAVLVLINFRDVGDYGRFEFWFAMVKLATIVAFIVIGGALLLGGRVAAQYMAQGGFLPQGPLSPLLAMLFALYTFGGIEFVAITTGESRSGDEIPKAVRMTFWILTLLYVGAIVVLIGVIPWNRVGAGESPFVTVFRTAKIPGAGAVMNFVVLTAALSAANAAWYVASRMLFSLARTGWAPAALGRLNKAGAPRLALLVSSFGIILALVLERWAPKDAFVWILSAAFCGLMMSWLVSLAAHVRFRQKLSPEQLAALPMRSRVGAWGSILGFACVMAAVLNTWRTSRVSMLSGLSYLILLSVAYLLLQRTRKLRMSSGTGP